MFFLTVICGLWRGFSTGSYARAVLQVEGDPDVHRRQLGGQVSEDVGHGHRLHAGAGFAGLAGVALGGFGRRKPSDLPHGSLVPLDGGRREDTAAEAAHVGDVVVGAAVEPIVEQVRRPMGEKRVPLHLPESDPSSPLSSADGLPGDLVDGARGANLK